MSDRMTVGIYLSCIILSIMLKVVKTQLKISLQCAMFAMMIYIKEIHRPKNC